MFATRAPTMSSIPPQLPSLESLQNVSQFNKSQPPQRNEFATTLPPLRTIDRSIDRDARGEHASVVSDEHERTRQERLKLERYKVKRDMLRELLQAGVHPSQIPMFFADNDSATSPTASPTEAQRYAPQPGSSPSLNTWDRSPLIAPPTSAARIPGHPPNQSPLLGAAVNSSPQHQHQVNYLRTQSSTSSTFNAASPPNAAPLATDFFSTSPRALQFKFYKPGPKPKVLRRKRGGAAATAPSPQAGIRKKSTRRLSNLSHGAASTSSSLAAAISQAGSPAEGQGASPETHNDTVMSDADEDSDADDDHEGEGSGSEAG